MDMTEKEYNTIMYPSLLEKIQGFRDRRNRDERIFRKVGFSALISGRVAMAKDLPTSESEYWFVDGDTPQESKKSSFSDKKESYKELIARVNGKV